jgi:hypothetical protein
VILSASFEEESIGSDHTKGTLSLYRCDQKVGEAQIKTQLGAFAIAGAALDVGRHSGEPVTDDYPGEAPYTFTGGTIDRVAIDVSGEPYACLNAAEASPPTPRPYPVGSRTEPRVERQTPGGHG